MQPIAWLLLLAIQIFALTSFADDCSDAMEEKRPAPSENLSTQGGALVPVSNAELSEKAKTTVTALIQDENKQAPTTRQRLTLLGFDQQNKIVKELSAAQDAFVEIAARSKDANHVTKKIQRLKHEMLSINPNQLDNPSALSRLLAKVPFFPSEEDRYQSRFLSAKATIQEIVSGLSATRQGLLDDAASLEKLRESLRAGITVLNEEIRFGSNLNDEFARQKEALSKDSVEATILEDAHFLVMQRVLDLQEQVAISLKSIQAIEVIVRGNVHLVANIDRAMSVTVAPLQIEAGSIIALNRQGNAMEALQSLSELNEQMMRANAERIRTQVTQIADATARPLIGIDTLQFCFKELEEIGNYLLNSRQERLNQITKSLKELQQLSAQAQASFERLSATRNQIGRNF